MLIVPHGFVGGNSVPCDPTAHSDNTDHAWVDEHRCRRLALHCLVGNRFGSLGGTLARGVHSVVVVLVVNRRVANCCGFEERTMAPYC